jgi:hypothetical protein
LILGTYADLKIIKTRSVVQIVVEVPLERGKEVTDLLGLPQPNAEIPVVLARLHADKIEKPTNVVQIEDHRPPEDMPLDDEPHKPPRPLSQIAGMFCNNVLFQTFIQEESEGWTHRPTTDEAAEWLRHSCGIKSRTELNTNEAAAARFHKIRVQYHAWQLVA